jgi:hypothetical protein
VTDPKDFVAYSCIMAAVKVPKAAAVARFGEGCIRRLIDWASSTTSATSAAVGS